MSWKSELFVVLATQSVAAGEHMDITDLGPAPI